MKKSRIVIVALLAVLAIVVIVRSYASRSGRAELLLIDPSDGFSDEEIQQMVDRLFLPERDQTNEEYLKSVGARANPYLLAALESDRAFTEKFPARKIPFVDQSPFERICDLLAETCPEEAVQPLLRYASHSDPHFRIKTAYLLGKIGTETCIQPAKQLMRESQFETRYSTISGIRAGLKEGRRNEAYLQKIFALLEPKLYEQHPQSLGQRSTTCHEADLLLEIDRERAASAMLSEKYFAASNMHLDRNLEALGKAKYPIPYDRFSPLLRELESKDLVAFESAMVAYARVPGSHTESYLMERLDSKNAIIRDGALHALSVLHGVDQADFYIRDLFDEVGWEQLTPPQQTYLAIRKYYKAIYYDGHSTYYQTEEGNHAAIVQSGFEQMGADQNAEVLRESMSVFGAEGPAADLDERLIQFARLSSPQIEMLTDLDGRFRSLRGPLDELLGRFVLKNESHFKPAP